MKIQFDKEVCEYLNLPSIPVKVWDGKTSFKEGVAITELALGGLAYAVCTFNAAVDKQPRIKKVFSNERFLNLEKVFVVPSYMDTKDIEHSDLDEASKAAATRLATEAMDLTKQEEGEENELDNLPEWIFDNVHNVDEAQAFVRSWNNTHNIKGRVPSNPETLKLRLYTIYKETHKNN